MSIARNLLVSVAFTFVAACASTPQTNSATNDTIGATPALFVARDADSTMYIYGTIHLRRTGAAWGGPHVEAALAESQEIWTELEMSPEGEARAQAEALRRGLVADSPLSAHLSAEDNARLATLSQSLGIPPQALERMRPWMAALTLAIVPMMRAGYDAQAGVDRAVAAWGREHGKTPRWFETPEEQINFFASMSEEAQVEMLRQSLEGAEESVEVINQLSDAWDRGDIVALENGVVGEMRTQYPEVYQSFFVDRNNAWMEVLSRELEGSGVDFVAVGSGHLYGSDGLIAQLRARGVRVERVQ